MEDSDAWTIQMTLVAPQNSLNPYHGHVTAAEEGTEAQRLRVACSGYYWQTKGLGFGPRSVLCNAMLDLRTRACLSLVTHSHLVSPASFGPRMLFYQVCYPRDTVGRLELNMSLTTDSTNRLTCRLQQEGHWKW